MFDTLFLNILNMSLGGSFVILFVLIIRLILHNAPKVFSYALWGIVLVRLACPFLPELSVSLVPVQAKPFTRDILYAETPQIYTGIQTIDQAVNPILPPAQPYNSVNPMQLVLFAGQVIWISGMLIFVLISILRFRKLKHMLVGAVQVQKNIYIADHIPSPFVLGFFKPSIYLPSSLTEAEKDYVLMHEKTHIRRFDHILKLIAYITLVFYWFHPLVWVSFRLFCRDMEMACDESVIKQLEPDARKGYTSALLHLSAGKHLMLQTPPAFGEGNIKPRILHIAKYKKPAFLAALAAGLFLFASCILLLANPHNERELLDKFTESARTGRPITWTSGEIIRLADLKKDSGILMQIPGYLAVHGGSERNNSYVLNDIVTYPFTHNGEDYNLQISYTKETLELYYITLQRISDGEMLFLYETPEDTANYGISLADGQAVKTYFNSRRSLDNYLKATLPDGLVTGPFNAALGNGGGCLLTSTEENVNLFLQDLTQYIDKEMLPASWYSPGGIVRFAGFPEITWENGIISQIFLPWNHSNMESGPESLDGCEVPACLQLISHDLYTIPYLESVQELYGEIPEEKQTVRLWYVFFATPESDTVYAIWLNADLYTKDQILDFAGSVTFTETAFEH